MTALPIMDNLLPTQSTINPVEKMCMNNERNYARTMFHDLYKKYFTQEAYRQPNKIRCISLFTKD